VFTPPLTGREIPSFGGKAPFAQIAARIWGLVAQGSWLGDQPTAPPK